MDIVQLQRAVAEAHAKALEKVQPVQGRNAVALIGCTGAGKTTLAVYAQGGRFMISRGRIAQMSGGSGGPEDFAVGSQRSSETRGMNTAALPNDLVLVDFAGTEDTEGLEQDLCAAIYRATGLKQAGSVRVVLVVHLDRFSINNSKGQPALRDLETVANLYGDLSQSDLESIGLVVSGQPSVLTGGDATRDILELVAEHLQEIKEAVDEKKVVISSGGRALLNHFFSESQKALKIKVPECDELLRLDKLIDSQCRVWPLNVLRKDDESQCIHLQRWLHSLKPAEGREWACELPPQCQEKVKSLLDELKDQVASKVLQDFGVKWAQDYALVDEVLNLLSFVNVLDSLKLLPAARAIETSLCEQLRSQNQVATEKVVNAVKLGTVQTLEDALCFLEDMDRFKKRLPKGVRISGWIETDLAKQNAVGIAAEELPKHFSDGLASVKWDAPKALFVGRFFETVKALGTLSHELLEIWARKFLENAEALKAKMSECSSCASVVYAFERLREYEDFLENVIKLMAPYGCQKLADGGLAQIIKEAKDGVEKQLDHLSREVVQQRSAAPSTPAPNWDRLLQLCGSTEIQAILGKEDLLQMFVYQPLSRKLSPQQSELDELCKVIEQAEPEEWGSLLRSFASRIEGMGELAQKLLESNELNFESFINQVMDSVKGSKNTILGAVALLKTPPAESQPRGAYAASVISGNTRVEAYGEVAPVRAGVPMRAANVEEALQVLVHLLPIDPLLPMMNGPIGNPVATALDSVGWVVKGAMKSVLKEGKIAQRNTWSALTLDNNLLPILKNLKELLGLAKDETLQRDGLSAPLQELIQEAESFLKSFLDTPLEAWKKASTTNFPGWLETFKEHLDTADLIRPLADLDEVTKARDELKSKIVEWRSACLSSAREALEDPEKWQDFIKYGVKGMLFEGSALYSRLDMKPEFASLVETAAETWKASANAAKASNTQKPWQKLKALSDALLTLSEEGAVGMRARGMRNSMGPVLERLEALMTENESRLVRLIKERKFVDAWRDVQRTKDHELFGERWRDEVVQAIEVDVEQLQRKGLNEAAAAAGQRALELLSELNKLPKEQQTQLEELTQKLEQTVTRKKQEATEQLTRALEGRGATKKATTKALEVLAALTGHSDEDIAHTFLADHIKKEKEALTIMELNALKEWIIRHDQVRDQLPDEFQSNIAAIDDLMAEFLKCFEAAVTELEPEIHALQSKKEWGTLGRKHAGLRDTIESVKNVKLMKPHSKTIRACMVVLGIGSDVKIATEKVKEGKGTFGPALMAIVTGADESLEELYCAINQELAKNMLDLDGDATLGHRLQVLNSFIAEVNDSPPDRLRGLWNQVKIEVQKKEPELRERAKIATQQMQSATKGEDLVCLANALVQLENFPGRVDRKGLLENLRSFWDGRVKKSLEKVKTDVAELNVQGLGVSIEPFRRWLRQLAGLPAEQQRLLLNTLEPSLSDLKAWIREALSDSVRRLSDPVKFQALLDKQHFAELSLKHQVARLLEDAFGITPPSFQKAEEMAKNAKEAAQKALGRRTAGLRDFNSHFKVLKAMSTDLPEVSKVAEYIQTLTEKVESEFIAPLQTKLNQASQPQEASQAIAELRGVASESPELFEDITKILTQELVRLKGRLSFAAMNEVGGLLGCVVDGQFVIQEHTEVFGAIRDLQNNATFRRAGETSNLEDVVNKLTTDSGLGGDENWNLRKLLQEHETDFERLRRQYLAKGTTPFEDVLARVRHDVQQAAQACSSSNPQSARVLLTHLAIAFTVVKCGLEVLAAATFEEEMDRMVRPHRSQILSLFRLLHIHGGPQVPLWQWLLTQTGLTARKIAPENHLVQVLTGEGKCLTLGLLASFLALKGIPSDIVCYRKFLTEQDSAAMKPFYEFLGIEKDVRYATFDELCSERLEGLKVAAKELMDSQTTPKGTSRRDVSNRALLIDEVDVFFGRSFYGETWDGGFKADSQEAKALIRYVFNEAMSGRPIRNILTTSPFQAVLARYSPKMRPALEGAALNLVENVKDFAKPKPHLDETTGLIGYKEKNEINYDIVYPNKTVFAYLNCEREGKLTKEQVDKHLGIDLLCGRFSFAEMPMGYKCILGVTGTLQELRDVQRIENILKSEYFFKHFTITPSIFGARNLTFSFGEHVDILATESDWLARIESLLKQEKGANNAVLAFFKNEEMLEKMPNFQDIATVTERTPAPRRKGYIASATAAGRVTLFVRAFGRGIDFQMPTGHQVVVLQTFLSSLSSEQTQIKGRTARQGKPGMYRMVLCAEHLEAKFGFRPEEIAALKNASGEQIRLALEGKQKEKMRSKAAGMGERKTKAAKVEQETRKWEQMLFDTAVSVDKKLEELCRWNNCYQQVHYTVLLDSSSSMFGEPWRQLQVAFQRFLEKLQEDGVVAASTLISIVIFNHATSTIATHRPAAEVTNINHLTCGGGTHFPAAFSECHRLMGRSPPSAKEHILFLTDGYGGDPTPQINALLDDHASRITNFTAIAFGSGANVAGMKQYGALFQARRITFRCMTPGDEASLIQTFIAAANSGPFHK